MFLANPVDIRPIDYRESIPVVANHLFENVDDVALGRYFRNGVLSLSRRYRCDDMLLIARPVSFQGVTMLLLRSVMSHEPVSGR